METKATADEDLAKSLFQRIVETLQAHGDHVAVSSFELMQSDLVSALLQFLTEDGMHCADILKYISPIHWLAQDV